MDISRKIGVGNSSVRINCLIASLTAAHSVALSHWPPFVFWLYSKLG